MILLRWTTTRITKITTVTRITTTTMTNPGFVALPMRVLNSVALSWMGKSVLTFQCGEELKIVLDLVTGFLVSVTFEKLWSSFLFGFWIPLVLKELERFVLLRLYDLVLEGFLFCLNLNWQITLFLLEHCWLVIMPCWTFFSYLKTRHLWALLNS